MIKKILIATSALLFSFACLAAEGQAGSEATKIELNKQYVELQKYPSPNIEVIEFFSFNCPSCFIFETQFHAPQTIKNNLPSGVAFKSYHLEVFGPLEKELAQAWAIANVLNITDEVSTALYLGIQKERNIKTADDIKAVFINLGVDGDKFESMKSNFVVLSFMAQQRQAIKEIKPASIPTFAVNRKYIIKTSGLDQSSDEATINDMSRVINYLTELKAAE